MANRLYTLTFDDIPLADGAEARIPDGYGGFSWTQAAVYNPDGSLPGYTTASGPNLAFIAEAGGIEIAGYEDSAAGTPLIMTRAAPFDLVSGDFSAAFRSGLQITLTAYADEAGTQPLGSVTFTADQDVARTVTFDSAVFSGVRRLEFSGNDSDATTKDYFGFDNLTLRNSVGVPCFTAGTAILTPRGAVRVEALRPGDLVCTVDNGPQPLLWIGGRDVRAPGPLQSPVVLRAEQARNLVVSPQHCVLQMLDGDEVFVRARHLSEVRPMLGRMARGRPQVRYLHLLFERHQVLLAEGVQSESFWPGPQALAALDPRGRKEILSLLPGLAGKTVEAAYGPRARRLVGRQALRGGRPSQA